MRAGVGGHVRCMVFCCKLHFTMLRSVQLVTPTLLFFYLGRQIIAPQKSVAMIDKASTIEAKIQSFIPGKLIVVSASESQVVFLEDVLCILSLLSTVVRGSCIPMIAHRVTTRHRHVSVACLYHTYCKKAIFPPTPEQGCTCTYLCFAAHGAYGSCNIFALLMAPRLFLVLYRMRVCGMCRRGSAGLSGVRLFMPITVMSRVAPQIFQLLLPEMGSNNGALILLVVMSVVAPFLSWARTLVEREKPSSASDARWAARGNPHL